MKAAKKAAKLAKKKKTGDLTTAEFSAGAASDVGALTSDAPKEDKKRKQADVDGSHATYGDTEASGQTSLQDEQRWCCECNSEFVFTVGEQQWFLDKGYLGGRTRCSDCTAAKKQRFGEQAGRGIAAAERAAKTTCYTCGKTGHKTSKCPEAPCYNCECPAPRCMAVQYVNCDAVIAFSPVTSEPRARGMICAGGLKGHQSKDCKKPRDNQAGGGICFKFQTGECTRGSTCRFAHIIEQAHA